MPEKQPMFSAEHEAAVAARYYDVNTGDGVVSFKHMGGRYCALRIVQDETNRGRTIQYLTKQEAEGLRDFLNRHMPPETSR